MGFALTMQGTSRNEGGGNVPWSCQNLPAHVHTSILSLSSQLDFAKMLKYLWFFKIPFLSPHINFLLNANKLFFLLLK